MPAIILMLVVIFFLSPNNLERLNKYSRSSDLKAVSLRDKHYQIKELEKKRISCRSPKNEAILDILIFITFYKAIDDNGNMRLDNWHIMLIKTYLVFYCCICMPAIYCYTVVWYVLTIAPSYLRWHWHAWKTLLGCIWLVLFLPTYEKFKQRVKTFPIEFYKELFRLKKWDWDDLPNN